MLQAEIYLEACVLASRLLSWVLSRLKLGGSVLWLGLALKWRWLLARCSKHRCLGSSPSSAQVPILGTLPAGRVCCYCGVMVPVNSFNPAVASSLALRSRVSHNQYMKRTREPPVNGPKCARKSLAHFDPSKGPLRAVYVGR
jgi:hypothetical protein